jgi:hypothetical protein
MKVRDREAIEGAAMLLQDHDVHLNVHGPDGWYELSPEEMGRFADNKDQFWANKFGISLKFYLSWKSMDGQCTNITKQGHRCKNPCSAVSDFPSSPRKFILGKSDRCKIHQLTPATGCGSDGKKG